MNHLDGKHALVTGGGSGIGAAIALSLAERGAMVTICGRRTAPLDALAKQHDQIQGITCDVTDETAVSELFDQGIKTRGPIRIVVSNAGAADSAPLHSTDLDLWSRMIDSNLKGTFLILREAMRRLREQAPAERWGRLIAVSSNAGLRGYAYVSAYSAAKHGVIGMVRSAALETRNTEITVNALCPGFTETPLLERSAHHIADTTGHGVESARRQMAEMNPGGRLIQPAEVAAAVQWLVGDGSASVNGQAIEISGGCA